MFSNEKRDLHDLKDFDEHFSCVDFCQDAKTGFHYLEVVCDDVIKEDLTSRNYIFAFLEGEFTISAGQFCDKPFKEGEMVCIPKNVTLNCRALSSGRLIVFGFNELLAACDMRYFSLYKSRCATLTYSMEPTPIIYPIAEFFKVKEYYIRNNMRCLHMQEIKHREFFMILRAFYDKEQLSNFLWPILTRMSSFSYYIYNNYRKYQSVTALIENSPYSRSVFFRKFKEEFGEISPSDWIRKRQADEIRELATIPNITVKEIMNRMRVDSMATFQRLCKELFSCTPKELISQLSITQELD